MKLKLLNHNEEWIDNIEVTEPKITEEVNGEDVLEFETAEEVKKGYRLLLKRRSGEWKEYIVSDYKRTKDHEGMIFEVFAESSFYETLGDYIEEERVRNATATVALTKALQHSRWEVGTVENFGLGTTTLYHMSVKEAVQKNILDTYKCEFRTRIEVAGNRVTRRYIDLVHTIGHDTGKRFVYNKDMWEIKKTVAKDDIVTALYGYGKGEEVGDGFGRRITFASINGGRAYVENDEARILYGRNSANGKEHFKGFVCFDDVEDKEELKRLTEKELEKRSKPNISYTATVDDLSRYGLEHEGVGVGDRVLIIDKEDGLRLSARVLKYVDYLDDTESNEITLGNFRSNLASEYAKQLEFINKFREKQGIWDRAGMFDKDGLKADFLKNLVEEMNIRMNNSGGYVYISDDGQGLITYDKPIDQNPTMAIQLVGGGFRIADGKKPDGTWNWKTFGDGHGFVADLIVAGMLKGGNVEFNLTDGTLLIGSSAEDYHLWWDGSKLWIKGDGVDLTANDTITGMQSRITQTASEIKTEVKNVDGRVTQISQTVEGVKTTAQNAQSKAEQALTADGYTRRIANNASNAASEAKQTAENVEWKFQNYSPDRVKYSSTYALTPSECYIAYNGRKTFQVSTYSGEVTLGGYGAYLKASDDRIEVKGLRTEGNLTLLGDIIMNGSHFYNGGLAIYFNAGTTYPIEMHQGVECMKGLYVHGAKSAVQVTSDGLRAVYCYETADNYFGDMGFGTLDENGECLVPIDPVFYDLVNTKNSYLVQLNKESPGELYTAEKNPSFFIVKGEPGMKFSWEIKAKRKNHELKRLDRVDEIKASVGQAEEKELVKELEQPSVIEELLIEEGDRFENSNWSNDHEA